MNRNLDQSPNFGKGLVFAEVSFATNGTGQPAAASIRGAKDALDATTPLNRTGVGIIRVLLRDKVRYVVTKYTDMDDGLSGADDGAYATAGPDVNDPGLTTAPTTGGTTPAFDVFTRAGATTTKTDFTGRRVNISMCLKNSTVGV